MSAMLRCWAAALLLCWGGAARAMSVEEFCAAYPERVTYLFEQLDTTREGIAPLAAQAASDPAAACRALLEYYRNQVPLKERAAAQEPPDTAEADAVLEDRYTVQKITSTAPRLAHGGLDWGHQGPNKYIEWAYGLNRFTHFTALVDAYELTGDPRYAARVSAELEDWGASHPYPGQRNDTPAWRGLEVALRIAPWARAFAALQHEQAFSDGARLHLLSLLARHAEYLRHYHASGNWLAMEMSGLAGIAAAWPEFVGAGGWLDYAVSTMERELTAQVYPDGVQKELTTTYHYVVIKNFESFARRLGEAGRTPPEQLATTLMRLWNYLAYTMRPDGFGLLNNDSDRTDNRTLVLEAAERHNRPDWKWIATNGAEGKAPPKGPHVFFPWAGHAVMRSGWDRDARWSFFDVGPLGIGHEHHDKLHLSLSAYGRDLLVDSGRYTYVKGVERTYYQSTAAHNTILFAGKGQKPGTRETRASLAAQYETGPGYSFAIGNHLEAYSDLRALAEHTRAVVLLDAGYWIVVDKLFSDRDQKVTALWHFHPDCEVSLEGSAAVTTDSGRGHLRIVPAGPVAWTPAIVKGQTVPRLQGWYSRAYNVQQPAPCVTYDAGIGSEYTWFAWILAPGEAVAPAVTAQFTLLAEDSVALEVAVGEQPPVRVEIDTLMASDKPRLRLP